MGRNQGAGARLRRGRVTTAAAIAAASACALLASSSAPSVRAQTVELVYASPGAYRAGVLAHRGAIVRTVAPLRLVELRTASTPGSLRREPGVVTAGRTVARASAGTPALTLGQVSTPAGGAFEWQWYATHADRVPASILAAAARTTIAIVDTGVDASSPALAGKVGGAFDVRGRGRGVADRTGHGTFVASIAGGTGAIAGFGGAARLLAVKVGDGSRISDVDVAAGIVAAVRRGARIVNVSIAGASPSAAEASAVAYAAKHGAVLVAPVGNDGLGGNAPQYPAALLRSTGAGLAVGASDSTGRRAAFSGYGSFVSLAAPGASVFGALSRGSDRSRYPRVALPGAPDSSFGFASGTSYAAPQVAGAAALVWAANPGLSSIQVAKVLEETASGGGSWRPELGAGILDVGAAVDAALRAAE